MYKSFYRLQKNPFEITPDPSFLFPTMRHNEALASLYYGATAQRGIVVLTGEVGTGKTLLVQSLLRLLQQRDVAFALIFNPTLSPLEFIRYIARDLGLSTTGKAKDELLHSLNELLLERHRRGSTSLLVVDEAHLLSSETLEEIRLLTNLETWQQKLLQIVLAGQPELDQKLDSYDLRQLKQRIALRCHLEPLSVNETAEYVYRRLKIAGTNAGGEIFPRATLASIHQHSGGIPRLINTICQNALLFGFAKQLSVITPEIVEAVVSELGLGTKQSVGKSNGNGAPTAVRNNDQELVQAVKKLLEVHDRMQNAVVKTRLQ